MKVNKNIRKLKSQPILLQFPDLMCVGECSIICSADAAFANLKNLSSQGAYIVFLCKSQRKHAPISWKSKKIQRVVKSTIAAETLYKKETDSGSFPIHCYTDNKSLLDSVYFTKTLKEKRLKVDVCIIREMLQKKVISSVNWCTSKIKLVDCLTSVSN